MTRVGKKKADADTIAGSLRAGRRSNSTHLSGFGPKGSRRSCVKQTGGAGFIRCLAMKPVEVTVGRLTFFSMRQPLPGCWPGLTIRVVLGGRSVFGDERVRGKTAAESGRAGPSIWRRWWPKATLKHGPGRPGFIKVPPCRWSTRPHSE